MARRHFASGGSRRLTQWVAPANQGYVVVADGGATVVSTIPFGVPATIVRTRGQVSIRPNSLAADAAIIGAIGMGIVSAEAVAIGVTAIPEPFTDGDWPGWFVWRSFSFLYEFQDATGTGIQTIDFEVDSKAMRKIGQNETIVFVAESQAGAFQVSSPVRMLIKLA